MAISVGSVEVDVVPNAQGIRSRLQASLVPAADEVGEEMGRVIGRHVSTQIAQAVRDGVTNGGRTAVAPAARQGQTTGSAFARSFKGRVEAALRDLPDIRIDADSSDADREIASIRTQLQTLRDTTVGVDIDAGEAQARIARIQAQLQRLEASDPDVNIRMDVGAASAQLAAFQAELNRLDGRDVKVRVDPVIRSFSMLTTAAAAFGPAIIPALPVVAAGLGAVAAMAVSAGVGLGAVGLVAVPAFKDIAGALQAQKAAQDAAATAAIKGGQANGQGAGKALQMAGAQQALATAHRNAARQIGQAEQGVADAVRNSAEANRQASQQVKQAEQGVADAVEQAADRQRDAAQQVKQARQSLATAIQQAADQQRAAAERVAAAEQSLADAQRSSRQAQLDLTQARRDAVVELQDLSNRLADAQLSERDAALGVQEAQQRLNDVRASGSKASALQVAQAELAYDQAVQRLKEQRLDTKRTAAEKKAADKAGVEGSETVKSAQERVALAQRQVREQTADLAKAQREAARQQQENALEIASAQGKVAESQRSAARAQEDSADAIAAAQGRLAEAQRNSSKVQGDGARSVGRAQGALAEAHLSASDSIASAQRQIASASQQAAGGVDQAAVAQAKYQEALGKLTPSARKTFNAFVALKGAFGDWSKSLQPAVMPIFTRALNGLRKSLPGLTPFVYAAADAIGDLQDRASRGFKSPWWKSFKKDLATSVRPAVIGLGVVFGNIFKGMAGIIQAFLPHMDEISDGAQRVTDRFADWGTSLKGSPAFERFLDYSNEQGPLLAETLGNLMSALFRLGVALAPLAVTARTFLDVLSGIIENTPVDVLTVLGVAFASLAIGAKLAALATGIWKAAQVGATIATAVLTGQTHALNAAMRANLIGIIITLIAAFIVSLIYAYQHSEKFRAIVQGAWHGIQAAASFAWNSVLKPTFNAIVTAIQWVGRTATWLWRNAIKPAFDGISLAARILITVIAVILIAPMVIAFKVAGAIGTWLWKTAIGPAFRKIGDLGKWLYAKAIKPAFDGIGASGRWLYRSAIKPATDGIVASFKFVGRIGSWLYKSAIKPAFQGIGDVGRWLYRSAIKPAFDGIAGRAKWLYDKGLKPAFNRIKEAVRLVGKAFDTAKKAIGTAFGKIKGIVKEPVNFVIKWVYTKGIKAVWDKIAGFVSLDKLPDAPKLLKAGGTVGNGFGPARPMVTNRPTAIVGEGRSQYPEYVIPTDPKYRSRAQALHAAAGTKLMAKGGILGPLDGAWDWTKDTVSDVVGKGIDWAKAGADLLTNPSKIWTKLVKPIVGKISKGVSGAGKFGAAIGKFPLKMISGLKDKIVSAVSSMFAGGGGGGEWAKPVNAKYGTRFGKKGSMWSSGYHTGLDFPAPTGTTIRAVNDGTVNQVASGGPYGKHVQISHGGGLSSFYAHMSSMVAKMHAHINRGKPVGKVGSTGNTTGPHLHLEARRNGKAVDPMPFLTGGGGGFTAQAAGAAQRYAKSILSNYGWGPSQFGPLKKLWNGESGWRWNALNKSSGAYGIPQALPASKMRSAGADYRSNAKTQIKWGLGYIKGRPDYGSPARAWSKWQSRSPHWYDDGGYLQPGLNLAYNGTGRPEPVFTGAQASALTRIAMSPTAGGGGEFTGDLYLDSGAFLGHVRGEVQQTMTDLTTALGAGRMR